MDSQLILYIREFLYKSFNIDKVKDRKNKKFTRGVIIDVNKVIYLSENGRDRIKRNVFESLKDIFNVDDEIIKKAMGGYLTPSKPKKRTTKRRPSQTPRLTNK